MPKEYLNPPELLDSRPYGFSQIAKTSGGVAWDHDARFRLSLKATG